MENRLRASQAQLRKFLRDNERYATHATPRRETLRQTWKRRMIDTLWALLIAAIIGSLAFWIGLKC